MVATGAADLRGVHVRIGGRVQGVGFRYFVVRLAETCGVSGYVRNLEDGTVEVRAEGSREAVEPFLASLRHGPRMAVVEEFRVLHVEAGGAFRGFGVRY